MVHHEGLAGVARLGATVDPQAMAVVGGLHPKLGPVGDECDGPDSKAQYQLSNAKKVGQLLPFEHPPTHVHITRRHICVSQHRSPDQNGVVRTGFRMELEHDYSITCIIHNTDSMLRVTVSVSSSIP